MSEKEIEILVDTIGAIKDNNNKITCETTDAMFYPDSDTWHAYKFPTIKSYIPPRFVDITKQGNLEHIKSFTIGNNISIKRTQGNRYIFRTPKGIASFKVPNINLTFVMFLLFDKYSGIKNTVLYNTKINDKLISAAQLPDRKKQELSNKEVSIKRLEKLGIPTYGLQQRIRNNIR